MKNTCSKMQSLIKSARWKALIVMAVLCFGSYAVMAQTLSYTHYWYNGKFYTNAGHTVESGYTDFYGLMTSSSVTTAVVRLDSDYSVPSTYSFRVESGKILTIDLNDKTLQAPSGVGSMFNVVGGVVNLYNKPGTKVVDNTIYFKKPTGSAYVNTTYTIDKGKIVLREGVRCAYVNNGGTFNLYSGTIMGTSNDVIVPIHDDGYSRGIMTGLVRNTPETNGDAGAFYVCGNNPGNVEPYSTLNIYGGVITKCFSGTYTYDESTHRYNNQGGWGGAIEIQPNNTGYIENGKIQFCQAAYAGGAICNHGTLTINNGDFDYNMCVCDYGSFLYLRQGGTLTINGGNYRYGTGGGQYHENNLGRTGYLIEFWSGEAVLSNATITGGIYEKSSGSAFFCGGNMAFNLNMTNAELRYNYSSGIRLTSPVGTATIGNGTKIHHNNLNWNASEGGGICLSTGTLTLTGNVEVYNNQAWRGGGIYADGGNGTLTINNGLYVHDNKATDKGGGIYVRNDITMNGGTVSNNTATNYGGGICVETPFEVDVRLNGGTISNNSAGRDGGGLAAVMVNVPTSPNYTQTIADNWGLSPFNLTYPASRVVSYTLPATYTLPEDGGVTIDDHLIYIGRTDGTGGPAHGAGNSYVTYELIQGTVAHVKVGKSDGSSGPTITGNHANNGNGGGIYQGKGDMTVYAGLVNNNGSKNGAGLYVNTGGTVNVTGGSITGNTASLNGGGIYAAGGNITVNPGNISTAVLSGNHADNGNGGAIYAGGGNVNFHDGTISGNSANNGGAIYANGGEVTFKDGIISNNQAHARGGGLYITETGELSLQGTATLTGNHVPSAGEGGGVYLLGVVKIGSEGGTVGTPKTDAITAEDNFADDDNNPSVINKYNRNNIFLPKPRISTDHKDVITIFANGMALYDGTSSTTHVGFSVPRNYVPVIYCASWEYLRDNKDELEATVFDDSEVYLTIWDGEPPYDRNHIYLSGLLWTQVVSTQPAGFTVDGSGNVTITTKEGLAWLISYVNGRTDTNPVDPNTMAGKKVTINLGEDQDLDMHQYGWVPIGYGGKKFQGEFEGNGNSITGIIVAFGDSQGVFGDVDGNAKISNVLVGNVVLSSMKYDANTYYMGGLACTVGGNAVVNSCGASGPMDCLETATGVVMGGLVGKLYGNATIHSSYAAAQMNGFTMGGLVGTMEGGSVKNCYSYPKFMAYSASTAYIGGLAATMSGGQFENCYTHEQAGSSHGSGKFGWFAGNYTAGQFNYVYAPENANYIHPTSTGTLNATGYGYFEPTALVNGKYGFKHQDQDVTKAVDEQTNDYIENGIVDENGNLKGLLATLNNWVDAQGSGTNYASWTRTMGSHINEDCPVLVFDEDVCLGTKDGTILYSTDVNDLLGTFLDGDIYLYGTNPTEITKSTKTYVRLYIAPNVGIQQNSSATLNARVGVLLDNSDGSYLGGKPYDWHMFSTPLSDAPLGLTYNPNGESYTPAYGIDPPQVDIQAGCYFPTNTPYGTPYTTSTGSFDFYCYHEPSSHWINLKRDSDDHWHQVEHTNITYTNESLLTPGKGYLLAVSYPTMVMADGTLTKGSFTSDVVKTEHPLSDSGLDGVNLVGNPYQSYLDFSAFAGDNGLTTYYILDADKHEYLPYTVGGTEGAETAPANLHPHQGFFVRVASTGTVQFKDSQRLSTGTVYSNFRGDRPKYPLVNLVCADGDGRNDCAIVELNRPDTGGGEKVIGLRAGDASLWVHYDDTDWHIAFMPEGIESVPVRFKAFEDGMYTLRWSTENADFGYLHLIDNMTGIDVDCLATDKYVFEGKTTDYISRFRLEFQCTGVEENDGNDNANVSFAYQMGDELIINGEGMLQLFDVNGRLLMSRETHGVQTSLSLPKVSAGVYVLRQTGIKGVRVQKMVIK